MTRIISLKISMHASSRPGENIRTGFTVQRRE